MREFLITLCNVMLECVGVEYLSNCACQGRRSLARRAGLIWPGFAPRAKRTRLED